jgi:hypothetical protein
MFAVVPACLLFLVGLGADAGASRDAGEPPPWLPKTKRADLSDEARYGLVRSGDGYVYDASHFQAKVARDGVVSFKDKHGSADFGFSLLPFLGKSPRPRGPTLESTLRGYFDKRRRPQPEPETEPAPLPRRIEQNEVCPPGSSCYWQPLPTLIEVHGTFDLTEEIMRTLGEDPYSLEKARFLSATFEFRIKLAMEARQTDLRKAFEDLPARLEELWSDQRYSPRERRRILYELWYETDRTPEGERAATIIRDFVRWRLACGPPDGFTRAELEALVKSHPERQLISPDGCQ